MKTRVAHIGTGLTGTYGLKGILDDPGLDFVGWWVHSPQKEGLDAGSYCGREPAGVLGTRDVDAILALKPDCLLYAATAARREEDACEDIVRFLEAGIDVVTFVLESMSYPPAGPVEVRKKLEAATKQGNSTFYATGSEPGLLTMPLPAVLLSGMGRVDSYREQQFGLDLANSYPVAEALRNSMGFGKPSGTMPPRISGGTVERWWGPNIYAIAGMLGVTVDGLDLVWETGDLPKNVETRVGTFEAGTVGAYRWELRGLVHGKPAIFIEYIASVTRDVPLPAHWPTLSAGKSGAIVYRIEGLPGLQVEVMIDPVGGISGGVPLTAMHCVNAMPHVVAARPGVVNALDLPYYTPRAPAFV